MPRKRPQRNPRGTPKPYLVRPGLWRVQIELPPDENGRRVRRVLSHATHDGLLEKARAARRSVEDYGDIPTAGSMTTEAWFTLWARDVAQVKANTRRMYTAHIRNYVVPAVGRRPLGKLTPADVRRVHQYVLTELRLTTSTAVRVHRIMHKALEDAVREGLIMSNPADRTATPRLVRTDQQALTAAQARAVIAATWEDWYGPRWAFGLLTGPRQGEVLGLRWENVNAKSGVIDLAWQLQRVSFRHGCARAGDAAGMWPCGRRRPGSCPDRVLDIQPGDDHVQLDGGLCLTRPKSAAGTRVLPITDPLAVVLARQSGQRAGGHGLVFTREDGRPIDPSDDNQRWHEALAAAGVPQMKQHAARHTAASLMLEAGVDVKVVQSLLGHSTAAQTHAYQHVSTSLGRAAMDAVAELLGPIPQLRAGHD